MPTVIDATVANQAYDTLSNGGRKLVRMSNGKLISLLKNGKYYEFYYSDDGVNWALFDFVFNASYGDLSAVTFNNFLYIIGAKANTTITTFIYNGDLNRVSYDSVIIDTGQTTLGNVSLAINNAGTELHAAWASKNSTYPNSFNIRYAKGTINADGSVTWVAVEQVTKVNTRNDFKNPSLVLYNGNPRIFFDTTGIQLYSTGSNNSSSIQMLAKDVGTTGNINLGTGWNFVGVYQGGSYAQSSPSACVDKNGRIWVAWHGTDATDKIYDNIRVSYSDDGGATWSAAQKLTSGNTYSQTNPSITVNRNNEIFIVWAGSDYTDSYSDIRMIKYNGSWGSISNISIGTTNHKWNPLALYDITLDFSTPLFIYQDKQGDKVGFYGTWTVTTISVPEGHLGQKTSADKSNILTYSITTEGEMSDIIEKINGVTIVTRTNPTNGQNFTVSLSQAQWDAIKYGNGHTLTIEMGSETWTYTFDKRLNANDDILSAVKGVQDLQDHLNAVKAQLAGAIRAKGGTVNDTDVWSTMLSVLNGLATKRWAMGVATSTSSYSSFINAGNTGTIPLYSVTVTGLTFKPSTIILIETVSTSMSIYSEIYDGYYFKTVKVFAYGSTGVTGSIYNIKGDVSPAYVNSTGFCLPAYYLSKTYTWLAIE